MKQLMNILKDKASLFKASLSLATKRDIFLIHKAIIHATAEANNSPPPDYWVATIINLGHDTREVARACIEAIMDRLHNNGNPYVKLKCLIIIHNIIFRGTFMLRDQLSILSKSGLVTRNTSPLLLPVFTGNFSEDIEPDHTDDDDSAMNLHTGSWWPPSERKKSETLELWQWVIWYTNVLERSLKTSIVLGCCFSSSTYTPFEKFKDTDSMNQSLEKDLLKEMDVLIFMIEEICGVPQLMDCSLVHEIVLLVSQEYGCLQHQIMMRLNEFSQRVEGLSSADSSELMSYLKRLKHCKKTLNQMYENRNRNDSFWELICQTKIEMEQLEERRERERMRAELEKSREKENERKRSEMEMLRSPLLSPPRQVERNEGSSVESTHSVGRVIRASRTLRFFPCCGSHDVAVEKVHLPASQALS